MKLESSHAVQKLGYLGLLPFVLAIVMKISGVTLFNLNGDAFFISYSAIILSFLSGALWGNAIDHAGNSVSKNALYLSNLFAVLAWAVLLVSGQNSQTALILLLLGFLGVWLSERLVRDIEREQDIDHYKSMRQRLTLIVVALHIICLVI